MKFGVIFLRDFALQALLRHFPELRKEPVALIDSNTPKAVILQVTAAARDAGVSARMTPTQGLARCSKLHIRARSFPREAATAAALLQCAFSCSPWVEATSEGVCTFELRNIGESSERQLAEKVIAHLARLTLDARLGFAENPDLALLAAHSAEPVLMVTDSRTFLADLPIATLRASEVVTTILRKWGVHTLGDLSALPKAQVAERLGGEARELWARATGRTMRLLKLAKQPQTFEESIEFEHEVETLEQLVFVLRRFLEQLALRLEAIYRVPEELTLRLTLASGETHERTFQIPSPTSDVEILFRILNTHLDGFTTDSPIVGLCLAAKPALPPRQQFGLFETALRDPNQFFETLARLNALLGPECVGTPLLDDTHQPDSFHIAEPDFSKASPQLASSDAKVPQFGLLLRRFRPPMPAEVRTRKLYPIWITSPEANGEICETRGPYQISGDWWDEQPWSAEEWDIQLADGSLYRISHYRTGWFLEGAYD